MKKKIKIGEKLRRGDPKAARTLGANGHAAVLKKNPNHQRDSIRSRWAKTTKKERREIMAGIVAKGAKKAKK